MPAGWVSFGFINVHLKKESSDMFKLYVQLIVRMRSDVISDDLLYNLVWALRYKPECSGFDSR